MSTDELIAQVDLFGEPVDTFKSALERYGVWPVTVWPLNMQDPSTRELKALIGDDGEARSDVGTGRRMGATYQTSLGTRENNVSIFNPQVAANLLNLYAQPGDHVYDPFAGGGTRAIMAAKAGCTYRGMELRLEEVQASNARIERAGLPVRGAFVIHGDARAGKVADGWADFLITCPPYYDLEQYDGGPDDLSMAPTYAAFLDMLYDVVVDTHRVLRPGGRAAWVVGIMRDKAGTLLPLHHDIAGLLRRAGFRMLEEIVLHVQNSGAIQRVGTFDKGQRHLVRVHEYCLVFQRP